MSRLKWASALLVLLVAFAVFTGPPVQDTDSAPTVTPPATLALSPAKRALIPPPTFPRQVWASWALLDRSTGKIRTGGQSGRNMTESMIKPFVVASYLSRHRRTSASERHMLSAMIRDSDNDAAEQIYRMGGGDALIRRVLRLCRMTDSDSKPAWWSQTKVTAADAARMGDCLADGRLADEADTAWILNEMRHVRGVGRFGVIEQADVPIKNGWTPRDTDGLWHVNCLGVADGWSLAVLTRYPMQWGLGYGARTCARVTAALIR